MTLPHDPQAVGRSSDLETPADPCLAFVNGWNAILAENAAIAEAHASDEDPDAAPNAHWQDQVALFSDKASAGDVPAATTAEGAAAALRRALAWGDMEAQDEAMIRAALGFFEGAEGGSETDL